MNDTHEETIWDKRKPRIWLVGRNGIFLDDAPPKGKISWMSIALNYVQDMILSSEEFPPETGLSLEITKADGEWFYVEMPYIMEHKLYNDYGKYVGELMRLRIKCHKADDYTELFEFSPPVRKYEIPEVGSDAWGHWVNGLRLYAKVMEKNGKLKANIRAFHDRCMEEMETLI